MFRISPQDRDYIIHVMRRMDLPCLIIIYTYTKMKNIMFNTYFARIITRTPFSVTLYVHYFLFGI